MFKKGDAIEVPAGTLVFRGGLFPEVTKRATKATVSEVVDRNTTFGPDLWQFFLTDEEYQKFIDAVKTNGGFDNGKLSLSDKSNLTGYYGIRNYLNLPVVAELRNIVKRRLGKFEIVWWSNNNVFTISSSLTLADTPKKESIVKKPNKRALMIKGSKWEATQDFDVMVHLFSIQRTPQANLPVPSMSIKKGTVFTILGKGEMGLRHDDSGQVKQYISMPVSLPAADVVLHPMPAQQPFYGKKYTTTPLVQKDTIFVLVPFDSFAPYVEQEGEAKEQYEYVIRDKATGKYYRTTNHNHFKHEANPEYTIWCQKFNEVSYQGGNFNLAKSQKWKDENPPPISGWYVPVESEPPFHMEEKLAKAKKHTDLGKVKTSIFNFTGYYSGLDDFSPDSPEWVGNNTDEGRDGYSWNLPETFEAVKIGKFSKEEIDTYDLQTWYKNALRLRTLTKTYGTSVREVFKKFEEKNLGGEYVVNFRTVEGRADKYVNKPMEPTDLQQIEDHIKEIGVKPMAKAKGVFCYSVLVGSVSEAIATRMVSDKFVVSIIDVKTMQEMVE